MVRSCPGGDRLTQREVAEVINHQWFRETFGLTEYRYVSVSAMSHHHVQLRKRREIRIVSKAVRYREGHVWHLHHAAKYATGLRFAPGNETAALITTAIKMALDPSHYPEVNVVR